MNQGKLEEELAEADRWLSSECGSLVREFLASKFGLDSQFSVVHHHIGQAEQHFVAVVDGSIVVEFEADASEVVASEEWEVQKYFIENRRMPKHFRKKIELAIKRSRPNGTNLDTFDKHDS